MSEGRWHRPDGDAPLPGSGRRAVPGLDDLLSAVARGDERAYDAVYDLTSGWVLGVARKVIRDPSLAEEVMQEVLLDVWRLASRFDPSKGSGQSWVMTLAHRRAVDRVRSERSHATRELRAARADIDYDDVTEAVEASLEAERVQRCLSSLTRLQRECVNMAYYGGYTYAEVAELLGVPSGTVKTRMRDGLIRLRDCLGVP
ncbi:MAG TPA: ECF RNA polymerase sigma factor SigK [Streptosporangiaceae bacterium]|nr:ECF RNA polymerase sigma factor SigK [Streptosporangiaceae bacterium]